MPWFEIFNRWRNVIAPARKDLEKNYGLKDQITFFHVNLTEFAAKITSLNPIARAANPGVKKPTAATGMAIML